MALNAHIEKQHFGESPIPADEPNLLAGAEIYKKQCAMCHGLPDRPVDYVNTMFPKPTQLFKGNGVTDDPACRKATGRRPNGIRLSGMPSFKNQLTNTQLWQVSQLVAHANELPASVRKVLVPDTPANSDALVKPKPTRVSISRVSRLWSKASNIQLKKVCADVRLLVSTFKKEGGEQR